MDLDFRDADDALSHGELTATCLPTCCEPSLTRAVRAAIGHLTQHYAEPVTLDDLSSVTKLNAYQLIRAFRRELGTTPHAWLIGYRVKIGTALLRAGESIATVASEVGFVDQTHFTRHFKRVHGETPARFLVARGCCKSDPARDGRAFRHGTHFEMARP